MFSAIRMVLAGVILNCGLVVDSAAFGAEGVVFDGYITGVHWYELTVEGVGDEATYSLKTKDLAANQWAEAVSASANEIAGKDEFKLYGGISAFPAQLDSLRGRNWAESDAFGWPDSNSVYVRHRQMVEEVGGRETTAYYYGLKDGSVPLDLIFAADNRLIAAIDVRNDTLMVRRGFENFTTVKRWRDPLVSQPTYGYRALGKIMMPASDGRKLATMVFLPEGDKAGPWPTVLIRTPYGISQLIGAFAQYPVRGFALVVQAAGGTAYWEPEARSDGEWDALLQEPGHGADVLEWISAQEWSNGDVCMQGGSYVGYTQWAASMASNPALKCLIPEVSMGTAFSDQPYMGGTFVQGMAYYIFWMLNKKPPPEKNWIDIMRHRPLADIDVYATGEDLESWNQYFDHWLNDEFWQRQNWYRGDHDRNFGTLQISGWFDDDFPGTRSNWAHISRRGTRPNRLLLGPWKHGYNADRKLNGFSFGIGALRDDIWLLKQRWYDHFLKGTDNGVTDRVVDYFVLGENQWRAATAWPPSEARDEQWFFHSTGTANRHPADGRLKTTRPAGDQSPERYVYDPQDPVQNWYSFDLMKNWSDYQSYPYDFKDIENRHDLATYTSAQFEEDLTIAGNVRVILYASTDVLDTDWWAYISDVTPTNESNRLSVGVLRARFRKLDDPIYHIFGSNFEREDLLSGNIEEVVRYEVSIPSVANTFIKGHRIRIAVMNALDNYSFPNSNTGGKEGYVTDTIPGNMVIHHSDDYPSHVILPVIPQVTQ